MFLPKPLSLGFAVLIVFLVGLVIPVAQSALAENAATLSGPAKSVIAQGVSAITTEDVAWRLVLDVAPVVGGAEAQERALGFALAIDGDLLVSDVNTGVQTVLAQGEASFVREGAAERRESLSNNETHYVRFALVPPGDATYTAGGELIYAGGAFAAPDGRRDFNLVRGSLRENESSDVAGTGTPALIYALDGTIAVDRGGSDEAVRLEAGTALAVDGNLEITALGGRAVFVTVTIGSAVPTLDDSTPVLVDGSGSISFEVFNCPVGMTLETFNGGDCLFSPNPADYVYELIAQDGSALTLDRAYIGDRGYGWGGLPFGAYAAAAVPGKLFGADYVMFREDGTWSEGAGVSISAESPDITIVVYTFGNIAGDGGGDPVLTGSVSVRIYDCPAEVTYLDLPQEPNQCVADLNAVEFAVLRSETLGIELSLAELQALQNAHGWVGLPFGAYELILDNSVQVVVVAGGQNVGEPYGNTALLWPITIDPQNPAVLLHLFALEP